MTDESLTAGQQFIKAWEDAGRPQVEHIVYPSQGHAIPRQLRYSDVLSIAGMDIPMEFKADKFSVELSWTFKPTLAEGVSSWSKLIYLVEEKKSV